MPCQCASRLTFCYGQAEMAARRRSDELERKAREVDAVNRRLAKAAAEAGPGKNLGAVPDTPLACCAHHGPGWYQRMCLVKTPATTLLAEKLDLVIPCTSK